MKLYKLLSIGIMLSFIFHGCDSSSDCCTIIDVDVQIYYKNELNEDLINSNSDYAESKIKVYYKNGDNYDYIYNSNLDDPNMHNLYKDESGRLILNVYPSNYYEGDHSITLIELNPNTVDTLICEFELDDNREICKNAWINGVELSDRFIELIK